MDGGEVHPLSVEALGTHDDQSRCGEHQFADEQLQPRGNETNYALSQSQNLLHQLPSHSIAEAYDHRGFVIAKSTESMSHFDLSRSLTAEARKDSFTRSSFRGEEAVDIKMDHSDDDAAAAKMAAAGASTPNAASGASEKSRSMEAPEQYNRDWFSQWEETFQNKMERYIQTVEDLILKQQHELLKAVREEILEGLWSSRRKFKETLLKKERKAAAQRESERPALGSDAALEKAVEKSIRASQRGKLSYMSKILPTETPEDERGERGSVTSSGSDQLLHFEQGGTKDLRDEIEHKQLAGLGKKVSRASHSRSRLTQSWQEIKRTLPKDMPQNCMSKITNTKLFGACSAGLILLNAIFIGIETDTAVACSLEERSLPDTYGTINKIFTSLFVVELVMRFLAERSWFFLGQDWRWNLFDSVLVLSGLIQMLLEGVVASMSFARLLRAFRMVRATRVIKVLRFFHELRRMVSSIVSSLASLGWALLLLGLIKYLVAICFTQAAAGYLREHYDLQDSEEVKGLKEWYSSLGMCMLSLMLSISGGADWYDVAKPLKGVSNLYMVLFVFYVFFVIFGVLNVLVGVFLASAAEVMDRDVIVQSEIMKTNAAVKELHMLFNEIDKNQTGQISLQELDEYLQDEKAQAYFAWNCLDPTDPYMLFKLMDKDGDGQVDMREFIFSMMKCKGSAKGTDMRAMLQEVKRTQEKLEMMTLALMEYPLVGCREPGARSQVVRESTCLTDGDRNIAERTVSAPTVITATHNGRVARPERIGNGSR